MFSALVGFALKPATALSQSVITGGALASVLTNAFTKHPKLPDRGVIDIDIALIFTPALLLGINTGVLSHAQPAYSHGQHGSGSNQHLSCD